MSTILNCRGSYGDRGYGLEHWTWHCRLCGMGSDQIRLWIVRGTHGEQPWAPYAPHAVCEKRNYLRSNFLHRDVRRRHVLSAVHDSVMTWLVTEWRLAAASLCDHDHLRTHAVFRFIEPLRHSQSVYCHAPKRHCPGTRSPLHHGERTGRPDRAYKASCTASDYCLANNAYRDAWYLLIDVRNLLDSMAGLAGRR